MRTLSFEAIGGLTSLGLLLLSCSSETTTPSGDSGIGGNTAGGSTNGGSTMSGGMAGLGVGGMGTGGLGTGGIGTGGAGVGGASRGGAGTGGAGFGGSGLGGLGMGGFGVGGIGTGGIGTGGIGTGGIGTGGIGTGGAQLQGGGPGSGGSGGGTGSCSPSVHTGDSCNLAIDVEQCQLSDRTCVCGGVNLWTCTPIGPGTGGTGAGGAETGGTETGGTETGGTGEGGSGEAGTPGLGGAPPGSTGPCDIYAEADTPCVAAYSMVRRILSTYSGPLYQVRSGSSAQNTGSGGEVHDIPMTADGFADKAAQDAACGGTTCTVSLLYDQTGNENNLPVAKGGRTDGGQWADDDDFESIANAGPLTVGGHQVYSLYMDQRQGYRTPVGVRGNQMPREQEAQGIYMLADGTHYGTACCWDFGNVSPDPKSYGVMNTLFFGEAFWGWGAGEGPWFMADYEAGVWAGGTNKGDPGWGALNDEHPQNPANPSLRVPFALGFLKTDPQNWALRMADVQTATSITEAYRGGLPKGMNNEGGIVLGVGGDNSNNSWGTFFEGAITQGWPTDEAEQAVMENIQAAGYGQ